MVVLTGGEQTVEFADRVPAVAMRLAEYLIPAAIILVLENGDNIEKDVPHAGRYGLLTYLDDPWQQPFVSVSAVRENGARLFVARLAYGSKPVIIIAPDAEWLDSRLRLVLTVECDDASLEG